MLFNSYEFLFLFLPVVLLGYWLLRTNRRRLVFLTWMSYVFYGWWDYRFCSLMLVSTLIDYVAGIRIGAAEDPAGRKRWVIFSLVSNLSLLGFFKYFDLLARTTNSVAGWFSGAPAALVPLLHVTLPVGISFYTFQSMSYSIDVYRGTAKPVRDFWDFACFVSLFPQLVAGPIVRYHELAEQLVSRTHTWEKGARGVTFFILGLAKKVILADGVALLVPRAFGAGPADLMDSWLGLLGYAMQIYFDFSAYSDMAIGLGLMMGFQFPQNFNSPYKALSITDFWRRWHMSLSTWLRDYLYIPLGGNRYGPWRTYVNLFLTMLLGGLWHGANWTFLVWGGYHGVLLAIERAAGKRGLLWWAPAVVQRAWTFLLVLGGWVLFRCGSLAEAGALFAGLAGFHGVGRPTLADPESTPIPFIMLGVCAAIAWLCPNTHELKHRYGFGLALALAVLLVASIGVIVVNSSSPFLYFQF